MLKPSELNRNVSAIDSQLRDILHNVASGDAPLEIVNNADWFSDMNLVTFIQECGKYVRMGDMLARDR
jgi:tyrosyl-tRNA synthetase